jgi:hypothetical protein
MLIRVKELESRDKIDPYGGLYKDGPYIDDAVKTAECTMTCGSKFMFVLVVQFPSGWVMGGDAENGGYHVF